MHPLIGKTVIFKYPSTQIKISYKNNKKFSFEGISGKYKNFRDTVDYNYIIVSDNIYFVNWYESNYDTNVSQVQNFNTNKVYTHIYGPDSLIKLKGTIIY